MEWVITIVSALLCGIGGTAIYRIIDRKKEKREEARSEHDLELKKKQLKIESENQRLAVLPRLEWEGTLIASPEARQLSFRLINNGHDCTMTGVTLPRTSWHLLSPHLPIDLKSNQSVEFRFNVPANDKALTETFPEYSIEFTFTDIHKRIYKSLFTVPKFGQTITMSAPELISDR